MLLFGRLTVHDPSNIPDYLLTKDSSAPMSSLQDYNYKCSSGDLEQSITGRMGEETDILFELHYHTSMETLNAQVKKEHTVLKVFSVKIYNMLHLLGFFFLFFFFHV